jgi:hypothetical protein
VSNKKKIDADAIMEKRITTAVSSLIKKLREDGLPWTGEGFVVLIGADDTHIETASASGADGPLVDEAVKRATDAYMDAMYGTSSDAPGQYL